eukprot:CAMPEP_0174840168 /NCGR_PEP_ID=MMETSP1114-20130205/8518_1 /TAXON_ID=312471 /ORGANISM="Neobodo designis, Strain CCAP 1951/1" /LENGTH=543 /DNA_ID=CAMNT_0016074305 /DNA_START=48 /DNA_END=1676 /DNA_ORIENTATION=+
MNRPVDLPGLLREHRGLACIANRFALTPDADMPRLLAASADLHSPPQLGLRCAVLMRAPSSNELVSLDVYADAACVALGIARLANERPALLEEIWRLIDAPTARLWLGDVEDLPPSHGGVDRKGSTVEPLEGPSSGGHLDANLHPSPRRSEPPASGDPTSAGNSLADLDASLAPAASESDDVRPPDPQSVSSAASTAGAVGTDDVLASAEDTASSSERPDTAVSTCAHPPTPVADDAEAVDAPFNCRYWTDVYFDPTAAEPGAVLFAAKVFTYDASTVHLLMPRRLGLHHGVSSLASILGRCNVRRFAYQHQPWAASAPCVSSPSMALATFAPSPKEHSVHVSHVNDPRSAPSSASSQRNSVVPRRSQEASIAAMTTTVSLLLRSGAAAANVSVDAPQTAPEPAPCASNTDTTRDSPPQGLADSAQQHPAPRRTFITGVNSGRFCARIVYGAGDSLHRCFVDAARIGAVPLPGDAVLVQPAAPDDATAATAQPTVATVLSVGAFSRGKLVGRQRLATVLRLATIADVHASERVVAAPIVAGAD